MRFGRRFRGARARLRLHWFLRRFFEAALAAVCLLSSSCGYIGGVLPPLANIPSDPTALAVVQRGSTLYAHFQIPPLTTELKPIKGDLELDLRAGVTPVPWDQTQWEAGARKVQPQSLKDGIAQYQIPSLGWTGKEVAVAVRVIGENGKSSNWSPRVTVPVVAPLAAPAGFTATTTAQGVRLTWRGAGHFRILRRDEAATEYAEIGTADAPEFVDSTAEFGKKYSYLAQAFTDLGDHREAQSDLSEERTLTPKDEFPPAPPAGLRATPSATTIELSWEANTESDLAAYRVYRSVDGGAFTKIADVSEIPAYSDRAVESGKTYRYAVAAVDKSGNESGRSAVAEATL